MEIRTQRLLLRPFQDKDQDTMLRLLTDARIKQTFMIPDFEEEEQLIRLFRRYQELSLSDKRIAGAIETEGRLIGFFNDTGIEGDSIELGYVIDPAFHNQGYMTEALKALISYLFERGFQEIGAGAFVENPASLRVMEKAGMRPSGKERDIEYRGNVHHCVYYNIYR